VVVVAMVAALNGSGCKKQSTEGGSVVVHGSSAKWKWLKKERKG